VAGEDSERVVRLRFYGSERTVGQTAGRSGLQVKTVLPYRVMPLSQVCTPGQ
jgi:hypothetical protein